MIRIEALPAPTSSTDLKQWGRLSGAALPWAIYQLYQRQKGLYVVIVPDTTTALRLEQELMVFFHENAAEVWTFPDWETLPYDVFSPHQDIISQRIKTLYSLPRLQHGIVIVPLNTALLRLTDASYLQQYSLVLKKRPATGFNSAASAIGRCGLSCCGSGDGTWRVFGAWILA